MKRRDRAFARGSKTDLRLSTFAAGNAGVHHREDFAKDEAFLEVGRAWRARAGRACRYHCGRSARGDTGAVPTLGKRQIPGDRRRSGPSQCEGKNRQAMGGFAFPYSPSISSSAAIRSSSADRRTPRRPLLNSSATDLFHPQRTRARSTLPITRMVPPRSRMHGPIDVALRRVQTRLGRHPRLAAPRREGIEWRTMGASSNARSASRKLSTPPAPRSAPLPCALHESRADRRESSRTNARRTAFTCRRATSTTERFSPASAGGSRIQIRAEAPSSRDVGELLFVLHPLRVVLGKFVCTTSWPRGNPEGSVIRFCSWQSSASVNIALSFRDAPCRAPAGGPARPAAELFGARVSPFAPARSKDQNYSARFGILRAQRSLLHREGAAIKCSAPAKRGWR